MKSYKVGDKVLFYVSLACKDPVEGKIIECLTNNAVDTYLIRLDDRNYEVHAQFIMGKIVPDKEVIASLEERILNDDKKLQVLNVRIVNLESELVRAKKKIVEQKDEIKRLGKRKSWDGLFDEDNDFLRRIPRRTPRLMDPPGPKCCKSSYNLEH